MLTIRLTEARPDEEVDQLGGSFLPVESCKQVLCEDADVFKPDGSPLLKLRRNIIPLDLCQKAFPVFREAATTTDNRGMAAGLVDSTKLSADAKNVADSSATRFRWKKKDGTRSNVLRANVVNSGLMGYMENDKKRFPYCRLTAFNLANEERFRDVMPFIQAVNEVFKQAMPARYEAQMREIQRTSPDFYLHGTAFTTITVNKNFRTAVHKDAGDLKAGFGVMSCLRAGFYTGCYLCFPKYGIGVDLRTADVLLADVHEWHGNTPLMGQPGKYERVSLVFYYRAGMQACGSATEELERAKQARGGL